MKILKSLLKILSISIIISCSSNSDGDGAKNTVVDKTSYKKIVFFGDSITAGFGLEPQQDYPKFIEEKLELGKINYTTINQSVSGDTSETAAKRITQALGGNIPDIFIIAVGVNDGLAKKNVKKTSDNLTSIINSVKFTYPNCKIMIAGFKYFWPDRGSYADKFEAIFPNIAKKHGLILIPDLLEGVTGNPLNTQLDGLHPNIFGQQIIANTVWSYLELQIDKPIQQ